MGTIQRPVNDYHTNKIAPEEGATLAPNLEMGLRIGAHSVVDQLRAF